ncbi:MAG: serine/threonine-protein kinase [Polyangiaceae bacterium]
MTAPKLGPGGIIAGKYSVRSMLGDGGSVITYHCVSQQGQEVAVKLYDPAVAGHAAVMKALEQAYAATNALPANSSAPIIDAGYDQPTVAPYSVTELLRLPSLLSQQRRLSPEEVVSLLKGLARSLDLAHLRQVVHGALKPSNVFVGPAANPTVVTDFAANLPKAAIPTAEGYALSAPWIAPEQAQSGQVSPAVDVFSTALVAFFALTGRSYWRSCQGPSLDLAGWQQELSGPRSPASARAAEMGVALSPSMDMVLFRALNADPKERYRSIGEFASLLEESMRQQVGSAATMALPLVGDAPSPLPANLQKPPANSGLGPPPANSSFASPSPNAGPMGGPGMAAPALGGVGAATMALPLSAILPGGMTEQGRPVPPAPPPPNAGFDPRMSQNNAPRTQLGMPMPTPPPDQGGGSTVLGMAFPPGAMQQQQQQPMGQSGGWQQAQPSGYGQQGYGDPGYPPPPGPNGIPTPAAPQRAGGKSKTIPIIIALTAVAILAGVAAIVVVKMNNSSAASPESTSSAVASNTTASTPEPAKTAEPPPKQTAGSDTTSGGSSSAPTPSASASADTPELIDVTITCKPDCESISVDGKAVENTGALHLEPGKHKISINKKGYLPINETIDVKAPKFEKAYTLNEVPTQVVRPPPCRPTFGHPCPR